MFNLNINKHALLITITKPWEIRFSLWFLFDVFIMELLMQHNFEDVDLINRRRRTRKNKPNNTHILLVTFSDSKTSRLHVDILQFYLIYLKNISIDSSKMIMKSRTSTDYFLNSTSSLVTNRRPSLDRSPHLLAAMNEVHPFSTAHPQLTGAGHR